MNYYQDKTKLLCELGLYILNKLDDKCFLKSLKRQSLVKLDITALAYKKAESNLVNRQEACYTADSAGAVP